MKKIVLSIEEKQFIANDIFQLEELNGEGLIDINENDLYNNVFDKDKKVLESLKKKGVIRLQRRWEEDHWLYTKAGFKLMQSMR